MNANKKQTKERPSERAMRLATQRAALDRILQATLREAGGVSPKDPTLTVHKAALWLQYALHRADTLTSSREERLPKRTPAEHLETMLECELDDPRDEIEARYGNLRDIAEELDPDFRRPIRDQADWFDPDQLAQRLQDLALNRAAVRPGPPRTLRNLTFVLPRKEGVPEQRCRVVELEYGHGVVMLEVLEEDRQPYDADGLCELAVDEFYNLRVAP